MGRTAEEPTPFRRGPFIELPERPRLPHPYGEAPKQEIVVESTAFGSVRTRVVTYGPETAPPLLLVHGLMTSSYSWRYLLEPLGSKYRLYVPDLPGCGESQPLPDRSHSGLALASFIGDLQAQLGVAACSVVGNSLGGYLCMQRALQEPQSFDRVVVIHAPAPPMDDSSHFAQVDSPAPLAGLVTGSSQLGYRDSRAKARSRESHHPWSARTRLS